MDKQKTSDKPIHIVRSKRSVEYLRRTETNRAIRAFEEKVKK